MLTVCSAFNASTVESCGYLWLYCVDRTQQDVELPEPGKYATGILFIDKDPSNAGVIEKAFEELAQQAGLEVHFCLTPSLWMYI